MKYKKIISIIVLTVFCALVLLSQVNTELFNKFLNYLDVEPILYEQKDADLLITVIDVGHGDSIFIKSFDTSGKAHFALIDTGSEKYSQRVINCLNKNNVGKLDFILISHTHSDHMGALFEVLKNRSADEIILPNYFKVKNNLLKYSSLRKLIKNKNIKIKNVKPNQRIPIGKASFNVIYPIVENKFNLPKDLNDSSIVGILQYESCEDFKMMFTGDATSKIEEKLINNYESNQLKCNILKLAHHGSNTSSSMNFLKIVSPDYCMISSGDDKNIIYPHKDVAKRLMELNVKYFNTRLNGNITIYLKNNIYNILVDCK